MAVRVLPLRRTLGRAVLAVTLLAAVVVVGGCVGPNSYTLVNLGGDLSPATVQRYETEWKALSAEQGGHGMAMLEHSNWWPLGLVAYQRDGMVMREDTPKGPVYTVMSGHGFGPFSLLYARSTHASFDASGKRISWMRMHNSLYGMLMMAHESDNMLSDGRREKSLSAHLLHHILSYHRADGHVYWSLFTIPNAIGVNLHSHSE
jgi:hypothetical protein